MTVTNNNIMRFALGTFLKAWMANCFRIARTPPAQGRAQRPHKAVQAGLLIFEKKRTSQKTLDLTLYLDLGHGQATWFVQLMQISDILRNIAICDTRLYMNS